MKNFKFYAPTRIYFGKDEENNVGKYLREYNPKKVLVLYGSNSAKKSGLLDRVFDSLKQEDIDYVSMGGVVANPVLSKVIEGIQLCKEENVDFILAVGGGSVMDSAKAIGYGVYNEGDVWDYYLKKKTVKGSLPIASIVTIAATGSEMSNSSVITNEDGLLKRGLSTDYGYCKFSIMDPQLTFTLPMYQSMSGCTDILLHTLERYFVPSEPMELNDQMAEALMRVVIQNAKIVKEDPTNYQARAEIMWAGSVSHNDMVGTRAWGDWACHQIEHELSGLFNVAHGAGLAAIWATWARYVSKQSPSRFARLGRNVFGIVEEDEMIAAQKGIDALEAFYHSIDMPISIPELLGRPCTQEEIDLLAYKCSHENKRTIGQYQVLDLQDMKNIYTLANQ